jgi:hypothetical protein
MFGAAWIATPSAAVLREGELSDELLAQLESRSRVVVPLVRISFPPIPETLQFSPDATELADSGHTVQGAATIAETIDDPPDTPDDDTTYTRSTTNNDFAESRVSFPNLPEGILSILAVRLFCRGKANFLSANFYDDGPWTFGLRIDGTNYISPGVASSTDEEDRFHHTSYKTHPIEFELNPETGLAWTVSEVDALQGVLITQPDGVGDFSGQRITQMYLEVDVTTEEIGQYSSETINSRSEGLYEGKIVNFERISRSVMNKKNSLESTSAGITIADGPDRKFAKFLASARGKQFRDSAVDIRLASPEVTDKTAWKTVFDGVVKSWVEIKPNEWRMKFSAQDDPMLAKIPKVKISEPDFPNADPKLYDNFAPIIYGRHSSFNITDDGMVQLYRVDTSGGTTGDNTFLVSFGRCLDILRIYAQKNNEAPVVLTEGTGADEWQRVSDTLALINGRQWTLIHFPGGFSTVDPSEWAFTADIEGFETIGDGTGVLIENPANQILHLVTNFVFGEWTSGLWLDPVDFPIDVDKFVETGDFLNELGQASSRYVGGKGSATKAKDEINRFTKNLELKVFWTSEGKLAILPNDHTTVDVLAEQTILDDGLHDLNDPDFSFDDSGLINRVFVSYIHQQDGGKFLANLEVQDFAVEEGEQESLQAFWLPSTLPGTGGVP